LAEVTKILCKLRHSAKHCEYLEHNNHKTLFSFLFNRLFLRERRGRGEEEENLSLNGFLLFSPLLA
jgi:hypothetical protein